MADAPVDVDAFSWPFQLTKSMHRDVYPAVDPANPKLSAKGKVVLVTGAGGAIGKARFETRTTHQLLCYN
jgi:FlaA1/EpsC-like NDP-sugar epimerase